MGAPWLCRWFKPSRGWRVNVLALMWCVHRRRHIDVSGQVSDKSNAALEGELSAMTPYRPGMEKQKKLCGGALGLILRMQTLQDAKWRPLIFTPVPAFTLNHTVWLQVCLSGLTLSENTEFTSYNHHMVRSKRCLSYERGKITPSSMYKLYNPLRPPFPGTFVTRWTTRLQQGVNPLRHVLTDAGNDNFLHTLEHELFNKHEMLKFGKHEEWLAACVPDTLSQQRVVYIHFTNSFDRS